VANYIFFIGQLNQAELSARIDSFLVTPTGDVEHLHNQLVAAIYGNVTREMPDHGVASWVSANDKPTTGAGSKPVSGDAAEQRLKTEVMQLPSRDRRRLKDLSQNEVRLLLGSVCPKLYAKYAAVRSPRCFCKHVRRTPPAKSC
jgi:transcriptional coactivator HFI1/ADA1